MIEAYWKPNVNESIFVRLTWKNTHPEFYMGDMRVYLPESVCLHRCIVDCLEEHGDSGYIVEVTRLSRKRDSNMSNLYGKSAHLYTIRRVSVNSPIPSGLTKSQYNEIAYNDGEQMWPTGTDSDYEYAAEPILKVLPWLEKREVQRTL